jgi:hypothetical protein
MALHTGIPTVIVNSAFCMIRETKEKELLFAVWLRR